MDADLIMRPTKCRICNFAFPGNPMQSARLLVENPQAKSRQLAAILSPLMKHLQKKHPQELQTAQLFGSEYAGMVSIEYFQIDDPIVREMIDKTRWITHAKTRRYTVSDQRIEERLELAFLNTVLREAKQPEVRQAHECDIQIRGKARAFLDSSLGNAILRTMRHMRDVLEERNSEHAHPVNTEPNVPADAKPTENTPAA